MLRLAEGARVELHGAGIASRAVAAAIDFAIAMAAIFALSGGALLGLDQLSDWWLGSGGAIAVLGVVVAFPLACELVTGGSTPGKRIIGLRVVTADGGLLTPRALLVRNVLRLVDAIPFPYGIGLTSAIVTAKGQRLGDIAAGTVVIRQVPVNAAALGPPAATALQYAAHRTPGVVVDPRIWDTGGLDEADLRAIRRFLDRRATLPTSVRQWTGEELARRVRPKLMGAPADLSAEALLEGAVLGSAPKAEGAQRGPRR